MICRGPDNRKKIPFFFFSPRPRKPRGKKKRGEIFFPNRFFGGGGKKSPMAFFPSPKNPETPPLARPLAARNHLVGCGPIQETGHSPKLSLTSEPFGSRKNLSAPGREKLSAAAAPRTRYSSGRSSICGGKPEHQTTCKPKKHAVGVNVAVGHGVEVHRRRERPTSGQTLAPGEEVIAEDRQGSLSHSRPAWSCPGRSGRSHTPRPVPLRVGG